MHVATGTALASGHLASAACYSQAAGAYPSGGGVGPVLWRLTLPWALVLAQALCLLRGSNPPGGPAVDGPRPPLALVQPSPSALPETPPAQQVTLRPAAQVPPRPPGQPPAGPGGADYPHRSVLRRSYGEGPLQFWLYEPADPRPVQAPVVIFLHGWSAMTPAPYEAWLQHLARRGQIVIYPRYQATLLTSPAEMTGHAVESVRLALRTLAQGDHVRPDRERVAVVGHSLGGVIAANLAALASAAGLPVPKAAMVVQPGDPPRTRLAIARGQPSIMADYGDLPADLLLLVVVSDADQTVGEETARQMFRAAWRVPPSQKNYVRVRSDVYGQPPLVADHHMPLAVAQPAPGAGEPGGGPWLAPADLAPPGEPPVLVWLQRAAFQLFDLVTGQPDILERLAPPDALDFFGLWKLLDGLTEAAFYFRDRAYALGNTPAQRFMGLWSDGTPVKEIEVTDPP